MFQSPRSWRTVHNADIKAFETSSKGSVATLSTELDGRRGSPYKAFGFHLPVSLDIPFWSSTRKLLYTTVYL